MNRLTLMISSDDSLTVPGALMDEPSLTDFSPLDDADSAVARLDAEAERETPLAVDLYTLTRFKRLMAAQGWRVLTAQMIFDRVYAHERLAWAHSSNDPALQRLALDMFRRMHAHDGEQTIGGANH